MGVELCVLLRHILSLYYFSLLIFYMTTSDNYSYDRSYDRYTLHDDLF